MNLPNWITLIRVLLTPFFFTELISYQNGGDQHRIAALTLFLIAAITDALDGFLARITGKRSELGKFLDPLADKLLLLSGFMGILLVHVLPYRPPVWITVAVVFRDLVIILGLVVFYLLDGRLRIQPNLLGKLTTAFQMMTLVAILLEWPYSFLLWNSTGFLTILSCLIYMKRELKNLKGIS